MGIGGGRGGEVTGRRGRVGRIPGGIGVGVPEGTVIYPQQVPVPPAGQFEGGTTVANEPGTAGQPDVGDHLNVYPATARGPPPVPVTFSGSATNVWSFFKSSGLIV